MRTETRVKEKDYLKIGLRNDDEGYREQTEESGYILTTEVG